jgi:hypothetical protein
MKNNTYRLRKNSPFGREGQIVSYNEKKKKWETDTGNVIEKKYLDCGEYFEELSQPKRWRAEKKEIYYCINRSDCVDSLQEEFDVLDNFCHKTHNYFKTEKEAQNKLDLINHIYDFEEPKYQEEYFFLINNNHWKLLVLQSYNRFTHDKPQYHAGIIMNINTTEKDRAERIRLLNLVYGK